MDPAFVEHGAVADAGRDLLPLSIQFITSSLFSGPRHAVKSRAHRLAKSPAPRQGQLVQDADFRLFRVSLAIFEQQARIRATAEEIGFPFHHSSKVSMRAGPMLSRVSTSLTSAFPFSSTLWLSNSTNGHEFRPGCTDGVGHKFRPFSLVNGDHERDNGHKHGTQPE